MWRNWSLLVWIAITHVFTRRRQSLVSVSGIVLGVGFFLAIAALMQGSEHDFIKRLVDNSAHITVSDEFRSPRKQPISHLFPEGAVEVRRVRPPFENRGIRNIQGIMDYLASMPGVDASPTFDGQAILTFSGRDLALAIHGVIPLDFKRVSTIDRFMLEGSLDELSANPSGIIIGSELARIFGISNKSSILLSGAASNKNLFKVLGIFRTGRSDVDLRQAFTHLKKTQSILNRPNKVNSVVIKVTDPYKARELAQEIESTVKYKSLSWQEVSEDILNTLVVRNTIMYTVVSAVLLVAAFGIYNVISTVVMEKYRDIAILKSMGFLDGDIQRIFLFQGIVLGVFGCSLGIPFGCGLMYGLEQIRFKPPGVTQPINMPIDWSWPQFAVVIFVAMFSATVAAIFPARKAAKIQPVNILRGIF